MSYKHAQKTFLLTDGEVVFEVGTGPAKLFRVPPHSFIDIISLDAVDGNPIKPDAGDYFIFVERVENGGFQPIVDGGNIKAKHTGGTAAPDGEVRGTSFAGPINRIKIKAENVTMATHAKVVIQQNLT